MGGVLLVSQQAMADTVSFNCSLASIRGATIEFTVVNTPSGHQLVSDPRNPEDFPIKQRGYSKEVEEFVMTLNGQGGDLRLNDKGLMLWGDDAGCNFATLLLYKDSGYQKGYFKASYHCEDREPFYSLVSCRKTVKR